MPEKYVHVDGIAVFVHHTGPTTRPDVAPDTARGELVLCLHGEGSNGHAFVPLLERLAARHSPLAFDFPAHARSGGLDSLGSVERMAEFLRALVEKLALRAPVLLGHSLGAAVALEYALAHPKEVRALVLAAGAARFDVPAARIEGIRRVTEGKDRRPFSLEGYSKATPREIVQRGVMEELKTDPRALYGDLTALRDFDPGARLGRVTAPALVLQGEDADAARRAASDALAAALPRARALAIPGAGAMLHLEQPEAVAAAVERFLAELPS